MTKYDRVFTILFSVFSIICILYFAVSFFNGAFFTDEVRSETFDEISYDKYIPIIGIALRNKTMLYSQNRITQ